MSDSSPFEIRMLPDEPIIVSTLSPGWEQGDYLNAGIEVLTKLLDEASQPCYYISDVRQVNMSLDVIIRSANVATRLSSAVLHHPNMLEILVVTENRIMDLASRGLNADAFGNVSVRVFSTVDDAFAYVRSQIA